ncbi:MAG: hypothetical protein LBV60_18865 [Streptomyces sp.]|nr:hypothetical protein [Streptomyces sp.]
MSAVRRSSSTARRTLLTAAIAGTLLGALWFVPSAGAAPHRSGQRTQSSTAGSAITASAGPEVQLADTGAVNTTPYVVGGTVFLCLGAGFVTYSVRRERMRAY